MANIQAFRTAVPIPDYPFKITYQHQLMSMGSCFAEHIGGRLQVRKFQHLLNPFGIVYHPLVLADLLDKLLINQQPEPSNLFEQQDLWRHADFHSRYAHPDKEIAFERMQFQFNKAAQQVPQLDYLLISLGTAYGYRRRETSKWVNNCHKQAASLFNKERATLAEIVKKLGQSLSALKQAAPKLQVILTVSPVRHLRDGLLENQRSKAILLLAVEELTKKLPFVHYFPAYEIMLDELRDYRFYARDMLHPSDVAVDYIWECFQTSFFSEETQTLSQRIESVTRALEHRHQHPNSAAALQFQEQLQAKIEALETAYDFLRF